MSFLWQIPETWIWVEMGDIAAVVGGGTPTTSERRNFGESGIPWITPADLSGFDGVYISRGSRYLSEIGFASCGARMLPAGTVLMSSRAPIGYLAVAANPVCTNQGFKSFVLPKFIDPKYILYFLKRARPLVDSLAGGTTFREISGANAARIPVPVPPLSEQRRIVAEIEKHFTIIAEALTLLDRAGRNVERYRTACLASVVDLESDWIETTVGDVAAVGTGATPKRGYRAFWDTGIVPWVTSAAVNKDEITEPTDFVSELALRETNLTVYPPGTLLLAMYGEGKTRGKISTLRCSAATNQAIAAIQVYDDSPVRVEFVKSVLLARYIETRRMSSGGVQPNLNLGLVKSIRFSYPPSPDRQRLIVDHIDRAMSVISDTRTGLAAAGARSARLRRAILAKAFSGQLIPQDPNDEPASVLLEQIRAQRGMPSKRVDRRRKASTPEELTFQS